MLLPGRQADCRAGDPAGVKPRDQLVDNIRYPCCMPAFKYTHQGDLQLVGFTLKCWQDIFIFGITDLLVEGDLFKHGVFFHHNTLDIS